jgi:hypothetical protein
VANETYHLDDKKLSRRFHGDEPIQLFIRPAAHSDGDTLGAGSVAPM